MIDHPKPSDIILLYLIGKANIEGLEEIIENESPITHDVAVRLGEYFNTTVEFWKNIQSNYDLSQD